MNSVNGNSIAQKSAIGLDGEQYLLDVAFVRQTVPYAGRRFCLMVNVLRHYLHIPAAVELLRQERRAVQFSPETAESIYECDNLLAAHDAPSLTLIQPPAPGAAKPKKKTSRRKQNRVVQIDPEIQRLAMAMHHRHGLQGAMRLLWMFQDIIRRQQEQGIADNFVSINAGFKALKTYGIIYDLPNFKNTLRDGENYGLFSGIDRSKKRVYIAGRKRIAAILTQLAHDCNLSQIVQQDRPGGSKDFYIDLGGSLKEFAGRVYAAWFAKNNGPTIARATLRTLWKRSTTQLIRWQEIAGITASQNYAQTADSTDPRIPDHAVSDRDDKTLWMWRRPNTYLAPSGIRQHNHRGQNRKARRASNEICDDRQHPDLCAGEQTDTVRNFGPEKPLEAYKAWVKATHSDLYVDYLSLGRQKRKHQEHPSICVWELMRDDRPPQTNAEDYHHIPSYRLVKYGDI